MNKKDLTGKDLLLCFLYSPGQTNNINEPIIGRTKLTKSLEVVMFVLITKICPSIQTKPPIKNTYR